MIYEPHQEMPYVVVEAMRLAERTEEKYPAAMLRDEAQDALVQLARYVRELDQRLAEAS